MHKKIKLYVFIFAMSFFMIGCDASTEPSEETVITDPTIIEPQPSDPTANPIDSKVIEVNHLIAALPERIELAYYDQIMEVVTAYNQLTDTQKNQVDYANVLWEAHDILNQLSHELDIARTYFNGIPSSLELADKEFIVLVRSVYELLSNEQKSLIDNFNDLLIAESFLANLEFQIFSVENRINELITPIDIDQEVMILRAREAYERLTTEQKGLVENYQILGQSEVLLGQIKQNITLVNSKIQQISPVVTWEDYAEISNIRHMYDSLSTVQKVRVDNLLRLEQAEEKLGLLKEYVDHVVQLIDQIQQPTTISNKIEIQSARLHYERLSEALKPMVSNYAILTSHEMSLITQENEVSSVIDLIYQVAIPIDISSEAALNEVNTHFQMLTTDQRLFVSNAHLLQKYIQQVNEMKQEVTEINELILSLDDSYDRQMRLSIYARYDKLTAEQKSLIENMDKLNQMNQQLDEDLMDVYAVEYLIRSIVFPIQISSKSAIDTAKAAYQTLSSDKQKLVMNYDILTQAELNLIHLETLPQQLTVQEIFALPLSRKVIATGVITGLTYNSQYNNSEIFIADSTGGILLFRVPNGSDLNVGDEIRILGTRSSFSGYPQLTFDATNTYEILSSGNNVDPIEMTDADDFTTMVGKFVYVTGTLAAKPNITTTSSNSSIIVNVGTKTVNVFIYASADYLYGAERVALVNKLNAMNAGETITVIGPVRWSGGAQVIAYNETNVLMGSYTVLTALEKAQAVANAITLPSEIQSDITLTLPTTGNYFSTITWESSDDAVIDAATGDVIVTLNVVSTVTLTAHVTVDSDTYSKNFIIEVGEIVHDISSARTMSNGDTVTVEGIVSAGTIGPSSANFFVQDDTGGINVFISSPTLDQQADIVVGNRIKITGSISFFNNQIQISSVTRLTYISSGTLVTPAVLTNLDELINYEGELVTMSAYLKDNGGIRDTVLIDLTDELSAYFNTNGDQIILSGINAGTLVTFTAPVGRRLTNVQLIVYSQDAVIIGSMGDNADLDVIAVNDLNLPSDGTEITTNITLPTTALFNRTISWVSSNPSVISNLGGVSRPENGDGNASVTLTGTFTRPDLTQFNIDVNLVVLEKEAFAGETTYVQDFSFLTTSTTTYSTSVTHTDTNGFSWSMLGRQEIGGWMLGNAADGSYVQVSATGGISSFSIDAVRAFTNTNARSFNVEVNGTVIGSFSVSTSSNTAQTFTLSNINVSGDVIIRVISTSPGSRGAFTVDDFTWTTFTP